MGVSAVAPGSDASVLTQLSPLRVSGLECVGFALSVWLPTIRVHGRHRSLYVAFRTGRWLYSAHSSVGADTRVASARIVCSVFVYTHILHSLRTRRKR